MPLQAASPKVAWRAAPLPTCSCFRPNGARARNVNRRVSSMTSTTPIQRLPDRRRQILDHRAGHASSAARTRIVPRLVDLGLAVLPIDAAQGGVKVERAAFQLVEIGQMLASRIDEFGAGPCIAEIAQRRIAGPPQWGEGGPDRAADGVAQIRGAERRQLDERPFGNAPNRQR